jgi:ABC-type nitrate/sulfonate/bicarbonate transport system ATPase subunit
MSAVEALPGPSPIPAYSLGGPLLTVKDVTLKFGNTEILNGVSGEIRDIVRPGLTQGQVIGLLGPSGRGKTQLSRVLAGLQDPTTGSVIVHDPKTGKGAPVQKGIMGMVMQHYPLLEHRTVLGNLRLAARLAGHQQDDKIESLLKRFGLRDRVDHYPAQLSGGQRQRIAIMQQILSSENFIIMDEPFSGLDPVMKHEAEQLITEIASMNEYMTIVVITHDIGSAVSVSDHLWMLGFAKDHSYAGSRIQERYDLIERGLAWQPDIRLTRGFADCVKEVTEKFYEL